MYNKWAVVTSNEAELLIKYASQAKGDIIELGCMHGGTTLILAKVCPAEYCVWSIDNVSSPTMSDIRDISRRLLDTRRSFLVVGHSRDVGRYWNKPIGFIFVDALHTYDYVLNDVRVWSKWLRKDGVVALHDSFITDDELCSQNGIHLGRYMGSVRAYQDLIQRYNWQLVEQVDSTAIIKRG